LYAEYEYWSHDENSAKWHYGLTIGTQEYLKDWQNKKKQQENKDLEGF